MKIVVLDECHATQSKLTFDRLKEFGELVTYYDTKEDEVLDRIYDADIVIENRIKLSKREMDHAKNLKFISTLSTGYNLVDVEYAKEKGIVVSNVPAYSSYAVAQATVALLLEVANKTAQFNDFVKANNWDRFDNPEMWAIPQIELFGKTIGIIGMGDIGFKVAKICEALGMKVLGYKRTPDLSLETENIKFASLDDVLAKSDFISLHCPLTTETNRLINKSRISQMKDGVIILNTSRGNILDEQDVFDALNSGKIRSIAVDVLKNEPPKSDDILISHPNTIITPHVAWAPEDTRIRLINIVYENLKGFLSNSPRNVVS